MALELKSTSFKNGDFIPRQFTGQGADKSPALQWQNAPEGTKSFALINDDPDAPGMTWVHWVIFNIPPDKTTLSEAVPTKGELPDGSRQGINDFGQIGYGGPMPPPGKAHRYFFKLYALDCMLELKSGITKSELLKAMQGHILAQAELVGLYKR
jgi:Raf kinase inhibitor-like YbhB/YbcL family protein